MLSVLELYLSQTLCSRNNGGVRYDSANPSERLHCMIRAWQNHMQQKINSIHFDPSNGLVHGRMVYVESGAGRTLQQYFLFSIQRSLPGSLETSSVGHEFHGLPEIASDVSEVKHIVRSSSQFVRELPLVTAVFDHSQCRRYH
ncbi:hypothetical protein CDAR_42081 [Caerostris darwini]|uniref:Uncharacterized protein n=1 Tax=Caerostris darwini TaxID=1538125 RepID=A0AAV4RGE3_9ARAC|nr:hypothetical protein CDAR_42081 [Caerostris darwini]